MVAVRRGGGGGLVVALAIFIILTFIAGGAAIWLWHQFSQTKSAVQANQGTFEEIVVGVFEDNNWAVSPIEEVQFGIEYADDAYLKVSEKLTEAATYESLRIILGLDTADAVKGVLDSSPLQADRIQANEPAYSTVNDLLTAREGYGNLYETMKEEVLALRTQVSNLQDRLSDKTKELTRVQESLLERINAEADDYSTKVNTEREKYDGLLSTHEKMREETAKWQQLYDDSVAQSEAMIAELEADVESLRQQYEAAQKAKIVAEKFEPDGKIMSIDRAYDFVVIEGGKDIGRKKNEKLLVLARTPGGEGAVKGSLLVVNVHERVSLASIDSGAAEILEGDAFATVPNWESFHRAEEQLAASGQE